MRRLTDPILGQLRRPHGRLAPVTAALLNVANRPINRWTVDALGLGGAEDVLDVGFGGGVGLSLVLQRLTTGRAIGIEISDEMIRRGTNVFRREIAEGRLRLTCAGVDAIPLRDASSDRAYTVNTVFFWPDVPAGFAELHRVLRPGGLLVIAAPTPAFPLTRAFGLAPGRGLSGPAEVRELVEEAGFTDVRLRRRAGAAMILGRR